MDNVQIVYSRTNIKNAQTNSGDIVQEYIPPHPQRGTDAHRFVLILLQQPGPLSGIRSLTEFLDAGAEIKGYSFFRSCWIKQCQQICSRENIPYKEFGQKINAPSTLKPSPYEGLTV